MQPDAAGLREGSAWLHAVGACPRLRALHHSAWGATAAHLRQYAMLQSLSSQTTFEPMQPSLVEGLTPLTRLQHLHLTRCMPLACTLLQGYQDALQLQQLHF